MSYDLALSSSVPMRPLQVYRGGLFAFPSFSLTQAKDNVIRLKNINNGLKLNNPISVPYKLEDGYYTILYSIEGLLLASVERNRVEMVNDFKYQLEEAWKYYACEKDENLTKGALADKRWLLDNISEA